MTCHKVEKGVLLILLVSISVSRYTMRGNTVIYLEYLMKNALSNMHLFTGIFREMHFRSNDHSKGNIAHCPHKIKVMSRTVAFP